MTRYVALLVPLCILSMGGKSCIDGKEVAAPTQSSAPPLLGCSVLLQRISGTCADYDGECMGGVIHWWMVGEGVMNKPGSGILYLNVIEAAWQASARVVPPATCTPIMGPVNGRQIMVNLDCGIRQADVSALIAREFRACLDN